MLWNSEAACPSSSRPRSSINAYHLPFTDWLGLDGDGPNLAP
jgi:hypothetical protein